MLPELLGPVLAAVAGVLIPVLRKLFQELFASSHPRDNLFKSKAGRIVLKILGVTESTATPRHQKLFSDLAKASTEMDRIVREIEAFTKGRQLAVAKIEGDLQMLSEQESELKKRVEGLQNVPLPAAEFFAKVIEEREKRGAVRDYLLFLAGVVVSAVVAVVLKKLGYG